MAMKLAKSGKKVVRVNMNAIKSSKKLEEIDQEFLKQILIKFDDSINESKAEELIKEAIDNFFFLL